MTKINQLLLWIKQELNKMHFFTLIGYLFLSFWVIFIDSDITGSYLDILFKLIFEITGILAVIELLKRLFPNVTFEDQNN